MPEQQLSCWLCAAPRRQSGWARHPLLRHLPARLPGTHRTELLGQKQGPQKPTKRHVLPSQEAGEKVGDSNQGITSKARQTSAHAWKQFHGGHRLKEGNRQRQGSLVVRTWFCLVDRNIIQGKAQNDAQEWQLIMQRLPCHIDGIMHRAVCSLRSLLSQPNTTLCATAPGLVHTSKATTGAQYALQQNSERKEPP